MTVVFSDFTRDRVVRQETHGKEQEHISGNVKNITGDFVLVVQKNSLAQSSDMNTDADAEPQERRSTTGIS